MHIAGTLFSIIGIGFLWIAWLMTNERLPRNDLVGMRTRATLASDAAWNAAHRASAWSVALTGVVLLVAGVWLLLNRQSPGTNRNAVIGTCVAIVIIIVAGGIQAHQVAKGTTSASSG